MSAPTLKDLHINLADRVTTAYGSNVRIRMLVGLRHGAAGWLAWWTFVAAGATVLAAMGAAAQGVLDGMRARPLI